MREFLGKRSRGRADATAAIGLDAKSKDIASSLRNAA